MISIVMKRGGMRIVLFKEANSITILGFK